MTDLHAKTAICLWNYTETGKYTEMAVTHQMSQTKKEPVKNTGTCYFGSVLSRNKKDVTQLAMVLGTVEAFEQVRYTTVYDSYCPPKTR